MRQLQVLKHKGTFTMDGSNFGGTIDVGTNCRWKYDGINGFRRDISALDTIGTMGSFTLDGAAANTGQTTSR